MTDSRAIPMTKDKPKLPAAEGAQSAPALLVVDDDRFALTTLADALGRHGYRVTAALSGEDALGKAAQSEFDLALLDVRMPGMTGIELAERLRADYGLHAMFLSSTGDVATVAEAAQHGALGYLVKPLDSTQVTAQILPSLQAALLRAKDLRELNEKTNQLGDALKKGREASMAIGVLMERCQVDRETAFAMLRDTARGQRRKVNEVAEELLRAVEVVNVFRRPK
jgi:two-component system, response regulator PdtaR